jgi:flagellin
MDAQLKILDTIKTKAIQAASDGQTTASRGAIQKDVNRLLEQLDNIAKTTSFNGQVLLSGKFSNKEFQIGAFSNQTIKTSIANTQSIATGNMATRTDTVQLGNTSSVDAAAAKGSTTISISAGGVVSTGANSAIGIAVGDTVKFNNVVGSYTIASVSSSGNFTLNTGLASAITSGTSMTVTSNANESLASYNVVSNATVITGGSVNGLAVGDTITVTYADASTATRTITAISGGSFTVSANFGGSPASIDMATRSTVGTAFATSDYVQYNVEGTTLQGVEMTDSNGYGVANTGLGRVADLINESTSTTGIKAVATVEANSTSTIAATTLTSDLKINGVVIMAAGKSILAGDSDGALEQAINGSQGLTGASATKEADGTLTITSDGRALKLEGGFTDVAGINDGVLAGSLDLTKNGLKVMDVTNTHYSNAALTTAGTGDISLIDSTVNHTLSELVTGQKDSNGDGVIDNSDAVGLLMTRKGAMLAMDIAEAGIGQLDSIRADLGSVQNQLSVTVDNISVTQVNVKSAESSIRDVDFAAESANFSKFNILAQSGSYAMSQANAVQQNVLRLLQ